MNDVDILRKVIFSNEVTMSNNIVFYEFNSIGRYKIDDDKISVEISKTIYVGDPLLIYVGCGQKIDEMKVFNEHVSKQDNTLMYLLDTKTIEIGYINAEEMTISISKQCLNCLEAISSIKTNVS